MVICLKYKRIIAFICCFVIVFNIVFVSASATGTTVGGVFSYVFSTLIDWFVSASVDGIVSNWAPIREASDKVANDTCSNSPTGHHDFTLKASAFSPEIHTETCRYCNVTWSSFFLEAERGFVDGLDRTEASAGVAVTGYSAGQMSNGSYSSYPYWNGIYRLVSSSPEKTLQLIKNLGVNDKALIVAISDRSPYELLGFYFDADGLFKCTVFENPVGYQNSSLLGVWSLSDLTVLNSDLGGWRNSSGYYFRLFYSRAYAEAYDGYIAKNCAYFDFSRDPYISGNDTYFYFFVKLSSQSEFDSYSSNWYLESTTDNGQVWNFKPNCPVVDSITWDNSRIVVQPTNTDASSRPAALLESLSNSTTNHYYYISPSGSDEMYSPAMYDEQTMVYTDPVTGTEYLTNGWTYDYLTRCYTLDMADGFTIGDAAIDTIKLTYGDELLTVDHYAAGTLIQSDEYNYVIAADSECALYGHTNVITDTQDPTRTAAGHRTYTCSVCGNQTVEDIPQIDHAYADFEILQDPTCTAPVSMPLPVAPAGQVYRDGSSSRS